MKTKNFVHVDAWFAYKDEFGSQYTIKDNRIVSEVDGHKSVDVGIKKVAHTDEVDPWVSVLLDLHAFSRWTTTYDFSRAKKLTIRYKTEGQNQLSLYFRTPGITAGHNLPYFSLEPSEEWTTKVLSFKDLKEPRIGSTAGCDLTNVDGIFYSFDFSKEGGEDRLQISHLSIDPYVVYEFSISKSGIYKSHPLMPLHYGAKHMMEWYAKGADFTIDWIRMKGPAFLKRFIWNKEFKRGRWDFLLDWYNQYLVGILEKEFHGGTILDLGCGFGNYATILEHLNYETFIGVDISELAIDQANATIKKSNVEFHATSIETFVPSKKVDCILMNEVVYYFEMQDFMKLILRYFEFLSDDGFIIMGIENKYDYDFLITYMLTVYPDMTVIPIDELPDFELHDKNGVILQLQKQDPAY